MPHAAQNDYGVEEWLTDHLSNDRTQTSSTSNPNSSSPVPTPTSSSKKSYAPHQRRIQAAITLLNAFLYEQQQSDTGQGGYIWNRDIPKIRPGPGFFDSGSLAGASDGSIARGVAVPAAETGEGKIRGKGKQKQRGADMILSMRTGGAVEDVWFVTYLLRLATTAASPGSLSEAAATLSPSNPAIPGAAAGTSGGGFLPRTLSQQLTIHVEDSDGAFLLIEAADALVTGMAPLGSRGEEGGAMRLENVGEWIDPDNARGRVWIYRGRLHLVSPFDEQEARRVGIVSPSLGASSSSNADAYTDTDPDQIGPLLPLYAAQRIVRAETKRFQTHAPRAIEAAAFAKLDEYPGAVRTDHTHVALACLPEKVARVLMLVDNAEAKGRGSGRQRQVGNLIARITTALMGRDVVSVRNATKMQVFISAVADGKKRGVRIPTEMGVDSTSSTSAAADGQQEKAVLVPVRMTKRIYTYLLTERFFPPKVFGSQWRNVVAVYQREFFGGEQAAAEAKGALGKEEEQERTRAKWLDLGAKIASGLEMLYAESRSRAQKRRGRRAAADSKAQGEDEAGYAEFIGALKRMGYFEEEMQDSKRWKALEQQAQQQWHQLRTSRAPKASSEHVQLESDAAEYDEEDDEDAAIAICELVETALKSSTVDDDVQDRSHLPMPQLQRLEDSDAWLAMTPDAREQFEREADPPAAMREETADGGATSAEDAAERYAAKQLEGFNSKMQEFLGLQGDHRGAVFADEDAAFRDGDSEEPSSGDEDDQAEAMDGVEDEESRAKAQARERLQALSGQEREAAMTKLGAEIEEKLNTAAAAPPSVTENAKAPPTAQQPMVFNPTASVVRITDDESGTETTKTIQPLSSEELRALFPDGLAPGDQDDEDGEVITEFVSPDVSRTAAASGSATHADAISHELSSDKRRAVDAEVKLLRSTLGKRSQVDGDSDSDSSLIDAEDAGDALEDRVEREKWLGVGSSGATAWKEGRQQEEDEDIDMQGEMNGFLHFATEYLGLSTAQYENILRERESRGGECKTMLSSDGS